MTWKEFVTDYFSFSRKDRIGILVIVSLIIGIFILPKTISLNNNLKPVNNDTAWITSLKKLEQRENDNKNASQNFYDDNANSYQYDKIVTDYNKNSTRELFFFDPNTLTDEEWSRLGLRNKTIATIRNYLNKGGHFKKPEDVQKIYGLFPNEYERIAPFIKIETSNRIKYNNDIANKSLQDNQPKNSYSSRYSNVEINLADTSDLIALPGIGSKLAARIISFRDKLGGFYSINQVGETFGLPDSTFQKIKQYLILTNTSVKKININTATIEELKAHPYIRYNLANPIVAYRNEHGPFNKVEDIMKVMAVTDEVYNKIAPYLGTK